MDRLDINDKKFDRLTGILGKIFTKKRKIFGKENTEQTVDNISDVIEMATGEESTEEEKELIKSLVLFRDTTVKQIMKPKPDIIAFDSDSNFEELLDFVAQWQFSRIPVYKENIDKIEGVIHVKNLFTVRNEKIDFDWHKLIHPVEFIPETKKIDELLKHMQRKRIQLCVVVNEYGSTTGLLTIEDILEEIVGEIKDEFDEEDENFNRIDDNTFIFEAKTLMNDFCRIVKEDLSYFEDVLGESESLGGLMLEIKEDIPKLGEEIVYKKYTFRVEAADGRKIKKVKVQINQNEEGNA